MIPARFGPVLFGFILSCLMSFIVSGIATVRSVGLGPDLMGFWIGSWLTSWFFAFPIVLVVAPIARKLVSKLVRAD
jgi:hypothetical protein